MTSIVNAEVDGHRLTDEEIGAFLILLSSAGNDTTKQTTSHAMLALVNNPEQRDWLMEDFDGRITWAIEEFVRWSSPVLQFARFATQDTEIAGQQINAGDKLVLFYCSANRDETVFDEPHAFDLRRSPNPHLGFGGGGPHFCLGNQLAKAELRNLFRELLTRLKTVEFGEPDLLLSNFVHGIKRLPAFVQ
jgi:cytochrome P450